MVEGEDKLASVEGEVNTRKTVSIDSSVKFAGFLGLGLAAIYLVGWMFTRSYYIQLGLWSIIQPDIPSTVFVGNAWQSCFLYLLLAGYFAPRLGKAPEFRWLGSGKAIPLFMTLGLLPLAADWSGFQQFEIYALIAFGVVAPFVAGALIHIAIFDNKIRAIHFSVIVAILLVITPLCLGTAHGKLHRTRPQHVFPIVTDKQNFQYYLPFATDNRLYVFKRAFGGKYPTYKILDATNEFITIHHND